MYAAQPVTFYDRPKMDGDFSMVLTQQETLLPKIIDLAGYEVGVCDIHCPEAALVHGQSYTITVWSRSAGFQKIPYRPGSSPQAHYGLREFDIVRSLEEALQGYVTIDIREDGLIEIKPQVTDHRVEFPVAVSRVLGLKENDLLLEEGKNIIGVGPVSPTLITEKVVLTANFVPTALINRRFVHLLYCGPSTMHGLQAGFNETTDGSFYAFQVNFETVFGERINVLDGQFTLTLRFRRKNPKPTEVADPWSMKLT